MISPPIKGTDPGEIDYDDGFDMMADEPVKENNQESNIEPINEWKKYKINLGKNIKKSQLITAFKTLIWKVNIWLFSL